MDDGGPGTTRPSAMATGIVDWAARTPDREAFVDVRRALTLAELDAAAASLAARLLDGSQPAGAGAPSWLPVMVDRSVSAAVALHGAIRAGRAFVPIEATTPPDLVAELLARLGGPTRAVVADPALAAHLPSGVAAIPVFGHAPAAATPQPVDPGAAGLVLLTSGSTGRPKGVVLPWDFLDGRAKSVLGAGPDPATGTWREGLVQPFGFAPGIRAAAVPCVGRTLCIADPSTMSVDDLLDWLDGQQIDTVGFPPSLSAAILRVVDGHPRLPSLSLLRSGAEASDWALVAPLRRLVGPHVTIQADYAASEVGRIAHFEIGPDHPVGEGRIPLGRLDPGVQARLDPVSDDGSVTELVVARPRALGYLGDPERTARRFVTDGDGLRWWKSGDIVRVDADGLYHHLGRADEMVKVRGMFVAPSRVERMLRGLPGIGAAAVMPRPTSDGSVRLVAHVRVDDDALTPEAVQAHLGERLPHLLMPAMVVRHDDLPRTERQKLDRRALERADLVRWRDEPARPPGSALEAWCLAEVRRIVGFDDVAPDDDLFEVGLDSLSVLELGAALTDAGYGDFDPSRVLEARTVAGICAQVARGAATGPSTAVVLNGGGTRPPLFALPGGGGTALTFRFLAEALGADRPVVVIEPRGLHRPGRPDRTVATMAAHAREEIEARLGPDDPVLLLGYSAGGPVAYEAVGRMHAAGRRVRLVLLDTAPTRGGRRTDAEVRGGAGSPRPVRVREASVRELPGALVRSLRYRWDRLRVRRIARWPGGPSYDEARYRAFMHILGTACRAYEPVPASFPATLIHTADDERERVCRRLIPDLSVHVVGGDHLTILEPPEVARLAAVIAEVADGAFADLSAC